MNILMKDFRIKMAVITSGALFVFLALSLFLVYMHNFNALRDTAGESNREMARLMADNISGVIDKEMDLMRLTASDEVINNAIKESNSRYGVDKNTAERYLMDMDKKWIESGDDHSLIKECLENKAAVRLKDVLGAENKIVNLLVTDRFGGIVGATARTPDFYQGAKDWWKEAFSGGTGKPYIGNVVYDEKAKTWCIPLVLPVKDKSGELIGLYRSLVDISLFFKPLEDFKFKRTGLASLVDDKGYLIYQRSAKPFANKFCSYEDLKKVLQSPDRWMILRGVYSQASKVFASFSQVQHRLLGEGQIGWIVFVTQGAGEVFAPLSKLFLQTFLIGIALILLLASAAFVIADLFMVPIRKIREGIDRIARGELDYRIDAGREAELMRLADSVNKMVATLKSWAPPVANLDKEMMQRRRLEDKLGQMSLGFLSAFSGLIRPIQSVKEGLSLILEEMPRAINDRQKKAISAADNSLKVISENVDKLLDTAKLESGKVDLNKRTVDIRSLLRNAIFVYEPKIRGSGLDLKLDVPKDPVNVSADADKITKVINNLIENAIKFTERGTITISIKDFNDDVECSVSDTGVGIKPVDIPGAFRRFPGLGLAIAKDIVEMHNGNISIESEFGKGTKLTFRLPKLKT